MLVLSEIVAILEIIREFVSSKLYPSDLLYFAQTIPVQHTIPVHLSIISWDDLWQISGNPGTSGPGEEGSERAGIF